MNTFCSGSLDLMMHIRIGSPPHQLQASCHLILVQSMEMICKQAFCLLLGSTRFSTFRISCKKHVIQVFERKRNVSRCGDAAQEPCAGHHVSSSAVFIRSQQTKRKLDDANKRLETLYDKLREETVSVVHTSLRPTGY